VDYVVLADQTKRMAVSVRGGYHYCSDEHVCTASEKDKAIPVLLTRNAFGPATAT
jgi:hypothetical protein